MRPGAARALTWLARWPVAGALVAAPLAFGAVVPAAYLPLLAVGGLAATASWIRRRALPGPRPRVPGTRALLVLHSIVVVQLVPLPRWVHGLLSPGSYALHYVPPPLHPGWFPLTASPPATRWGLAFLCGMSLLYAAVATEACDTRWRHRLAGALVCAGTLLSLAGMVQASSANPRAIYGMVRPAFDWAVFGPYVNRNHFAGHLAMVAPVAIAFALTSLGKAADLRRRAGFWGALGTPDGTAAMWRSGVAAFIVVGLLLSQSRGGILSFGAAVLIQAALTRRRRGLVVVLAVALVVGGVTTVDLGAFFGGFDARGFNRWALWRDLIRLVPQFPLFGFGFGAFEVAYRPYQSVLGTDIVPAAHNDYLDVLLQTGALGAAAAFALVATVVRAAWRRRGEGPLTAGLFAGVAASMIHAAGDFNWQIPANAATFAALVGLAMARARPDP